MRSFRESSPTSGTFPLSLAFCPFIPRLLSGKFHDKLVFLTPTFFGLYQLNIECRLLFYQLLIPDKGERAGVILPFWVWELGFPKKKKMETWNLREGPARFQNTVSLPQPSSCCENAVKVNAICALQHRFLRHTRHFHSPHYNGDLEAILRERPHSALDSR